jgi:hypothetical protein
MIRDRLFCNDENFGLHGQLRHITPEKLIAIGRALTQTALIFS